MSTTTPPTMAQAEARGLLVPKDGVHTFSNGTAWECWAEPNCYSCWHWDPDVLGGRCAFEGAAFLDMVTPDLARLFGWAQRTEEYGPLSGWSPPQRCAFFRSRTNDGGGDNPPSPEPDPLQLVLLADPTEDAALAVLAEPALEVVAP